MKTRFSSIDIQSVIMLTSGGREAVSGIMEAIVRVSSQMADGRR